MFVFSGLQDAVLHTLDEKKYKIEVKKEFKAKFVAYISAPMSFNAQ